MASQQYINIGTTPNDGDGDPLRTSFSKVNDNFANLFSTFVNTSESYTVGSTPNQVIFETPANAFTMGQMTIYSVDTVTNDTQTIQLLAQLNAAGDGVAFSGYGTTFSGNAVATFDMDLVSGNVRILSTPLASDIVFHFIGSQNMWTGEDIPGLNLQLDGYVAESLLATEDGFVLTTEN